MSKWTDLEAMLDDIARHVRKTGDIILTADTILDVRFIIYKPGPPSSDDYSEEWTLPHRRLKEGLAAIEAKNTLKGRLLRECFATSEGRQRLAKNFPRPTKEELNPPPSRFDREDPI